MIPSIPFNQVRKFVTTAYEEDTQRREAAIDELKAPVEPTARAIMQLLDQPAGAGCWKKTGSGWIWSVNTGLGNAHRVIISVKAAEPQIAVIRLLGDEPDAMRTEINVIEKPYEFQLAVANRMDIDSESNFITSTAKDLANESQWLADVKAWKAAVEGNRFLAGLYTWQKLTPEKREEHASWMAAFIRTDEDLGSIASWRLAVAADMTHQGWDKWRTRDPRPPHTADGGPPTPASIPVDSLGITPDDRQVRLMYAAEDFGGVALEIKKGMAVMCTKQPNGAYTVFRADRDTGPSVVNVPASKLQHQPTLGPVKWDTFPPDAEHKFAAPAPPPAPPKAQVVLGRCMATVRQEFHMVRGTKFEDLKLEPQHIDLVMEVHYNTAGGVLRNPVVMSVPGPLKFGDAAPINEALEQAFGPGKYLR